MKSNTTTIYQCFSRSVFQWDRRLEEDSAFVQEGDRSCSADVTHRSCADSKSEGAGVKKQICIDFRDVKCVSGEYDRPYLETIR